MGPAVDALPKFTMDPALPLCQCATVVQLAHLVEAQMSKVKKVGLTLDAPFSWISEATFINAFIVSARLHQMQHAR